MIEFINIKERERWNSLVKKYTEWDVYYINEYATSLRIHGDGEPYLIHWNNGGKEICFALIVEDIADDNNFEGKLEKEQFFDANIPYGYGGPLVNDKLTELDKSIFINELKIECKKRNIVSVFFRFHPLLKNYNQFANEFETKTFKSTIFIDTKDEQTIWTNMESKNRNMVKKAIKEGVSIYFDNGENIDRFIELYNATMDGHSADSYYYFDKKYYDFIINEMKDNVIFGYSVLDNRIIGAAIFFYNDKFMHYHLSGTDYEYRKYASSNLLLFEAAKWASNNGIEKFHLGGGINADDNLFKFKKKFNKYGEVPFYVGRLITDKEKYEELLNCRFDLDRTFDVNNNFMIQYRK